MENMFYIGITLIAIVLLKWIFKIDFKKAKELQEDKELEKLTDKFPENIKIAKEMLDMLDNKKVKVEEVKDTKTSLYIAITDKILIADMKNNYGRIQTIAHECLHSIQDRGLLLFNFIFSNINMLYWLVITILTITKVITNVKMQLFVLLLMAMIKVIVRGYLEIDAMTKSRYLAEKYMNTKAILEKAEEEKLLNKYNEINKYGIPYTIVYIAISSLLGILGYAIVTII